jgi:MFS transporter, MHS family, alpha-ketoglutarate permease
MSEKPFRLKAIIGGSIGNLVEWYDWYAYSAFALYFSGAFFPDANPTAKLLQTAGVFALGFLMRPVGGWVFGRIADKHGRKKAMTLSVLLMSFGSLLIALVPNYSTIGVAAPIILTLARLLQGLSVGGEYGVSATYLSEMATSKSRGFYSSFQYVTLVGGQLVALGVQLLLQAFILTEAQLYSWGWRIPFVIGAILAVVALYLRKSLHETEAFENTLPIANGTHPHSHPHSVSPSVSDKRGTIRELLKHPKAILTVVGLTLGGTLAFYTFTTYMQKFLVNTAHFSVAQSTSITAVSLLIFIFLQPLFGALSDRIGRKPLLIGFGILGTLCTIPLLTALGNTHTQGMATFLLLLGLIVVSGYTSINAVVKAELFPAEIRALGVGLPYALTVALFGGTAEYIALWFKSMGHESWFYYYITGCVFFSLIVYAFMKETKKNSKIG